jgi:uncharacterized membrane protein YvbJ
LPSFANKILEKSMFCPFCGRQNKENAVFCEYCGKAMQKNIQLPKANQRPKKTSRIGLSYNAKRAIITGVLIVGVVLVVLLIYYPSVFPWNW